MPPKQKYIYIYAFTVLGADVVRVHGSRKKERHVSRHMVLIDQLIDLGKYVNVLLCGQRVGQELTELDKRVLTLVVEGAGQLQVLLVTRDDVAFAARLVLVNDEVPLLREQHTERQNEAVVGERLLQARRTLLDVSYRVEVAGLLAQDVAARHRLQLQVVDLGKDLWGCYMYLSN